MKIQFDDVEIECIIYLHTNYKNLRAIDPEDNDEVYFDYPDYCGFKKSNLLSSDFVDLIQSILSYRGKEFSKSKKPIQFCRNYYFCGV